MPLNFLDKKIEEIQQKNDELERIRRDRIDLNITNRKLCKRLYAWKKHLEDRIGRNDFINNIENIETGVVILLRQLGQNQEANDEEGDAGAANAAADAVQHDLAIANAAANAANDVEQAMVIDNQGGGEVAEDDRHVRPRHQGGSSRRISRRSKRSNRLRRKNNLRKKKSKKSYQLSRKKRRSNRKKKN